jgi:hypothetical protein
MATLADRFSEDNDLTAITWIMGKKKNEKRKR